MKCICCGKEAEDGSYDSMPCCFDCYQNGTLKKFLEKKSGQQKEHGLRIAGSDEPYKDCNHPDMI
jgi:hypothetical protein